MIESNSLFDFNVMMTKEQLWEREVKANKALRRDLDIVLQDLKLCPASRERALSITKIQEAIMWLGMDLKRLNKGSSPYTESYNPENTEIHTTEGDLKM